jgi:hypothetical protein
MSFIELIVRRIEQYRATTEPINVAILLAEESLRYVSDILMRHAGRGDDGATTTQRLLSILDDGRNYGESRLGQQETSTASFDFSVDHSMMVFSIIVNVWGSQEARPNKILPHKIVSMYHSIQTIGTMIDIIPKCGPGVASSHRRALIAALENPQPVPTLGKPLYVVDHIRQQEAIREADYKRRIDDERKRLESLYGQEHAASVPPDFASVDMGGNPDDVYVRATKERIFRELLGEFQEEDGPI